MFARLTSLLLTVSLVTTPDVFARRQKPCPVPVEATDSKFVPGQVWSFKGRSFEPDATFTILKIESLPKIGTVVHVRLDGIRLRNCSGGPEPSTVQHAPFVRQALERSALRLLRTGLVPAFSEGYDRWRADCGGVYTITAGEMVAVDEATFNSRSSCSLSPSA